MVDVVSKTCIYDGCTINPRYGIPGHGPTCCSKHVTKSMIYNPTRKCRVTDCNELAIYGVKDHLHCEKHKKKNEHNFIEQKCTSCGLMEILGTDMLCRYCNPTNFNSNRLFHQKSVEKFLIDNNFKFEQTDKIIDSGICGKERPDFLFDCGSHYLVVEVDEDQHISNSCECEQTRMVNISQSLGLATWFIRYNPDRYVPKGEKKKQEGVLSIERLKKLAETVMYCMEMNPINNNAFIQVIYLFFDE